MKNRTTVGHGTLTDLSEYLKKNGWSIEETIGKYEVLRARKDGYPRPLLIYCRERGCGYSIDERDIKVYRKWHSDRRKRGLNPYSASTEIEKEERNNVLKTFANAK